MGDPRASDLRAWLRSVEPTSAATTIAHAVQAWRNREAELWDVGGLTAARFINNQAHNFLGFVSHAMLGCESARRLSNGQSTTVRLHLLCKALHEVVSDMHDARVAPFELVDFWPVVANTTDVSIQWLRRDVAAGEYMRADHLLCGLRGAMPRDSLLDLILDIGLAGMLADEHTIISPVLCMAACERIGWDEGFVMLRWAVRYSASFPRCVDGYERSARLVSRYSLADAARETGYDGGQVKALADAFSASAPADRPGLAAQALASGHSADTVLAAASIAACRLYLMVRPVPHEDFDAIGREVAPLHIGTALNALREGVGVMFPHTRALAVIQAGRLLERGPSILNENFAFVPFEPARPYPYEEDVAPLALVRAEALLNVLEESLVARDIRSATAAVQAYADQCGAPELVISILLNAACMDDGTSMHSVKHLNAMIAEFRTSPEPERWSFLVAAARFAAWYAGLHREVYYEVAFAIGSANGP
jgi:hypothetical protein